MKIAIHHRPGSFSDQWINYCNAQKIEYKLVNAYSNDIMYQLSDCDVFLWHHSNHDYRDAIFAKQLLFSLKNRNIIIFPDFNTNWHFDDKVGQKYLLESINAPLINSYVFYTKKEALEWIEETKFPKVFKLRGGSGSSNVKLITNKKNAKKIIRKAFGKGFEQFDKINHLKFRINNYKSGKEGFSAIIKGLVRTLIGKKYSNNSPKEKGYVYFQDFIPDNTFDTRIVVINGEFAAAERRFVRDGDFRASGSGKYSYDHINLEALKVAFNVARKLSLQTVAFDFVLNNNNSPLIVEVSYGFGVDGISRAPGYWTNDLVFHHQQFIPEEMILTSLIKDS